MGADYEQFILILKLKLTLDDRNGKSSSGKSDNALLKQSITQILIGIFFALLLNIIKSPFTFYYFAHTFVMLMMAMMIISEFTTILFDTSENAIIQPLPVKGNTISLARNAHVFVYLALTAFNLSLLSIIVAIIKFGIASGLIFVFTIILNVMFTLFLANILYLGIMHLATGEKLKNLLMYFQIAVAILFMAGYQVGMRIVDTSAIQNITVPIHWFTFLIPPAFFSGFVDGLTSLNFDQPHLVFIIEALFVPLVAIYFTGRYLTPEFSHKLMDLEQGERNPGVKTEGSGGRLWYRLMSLLFVFNAEERASFRLMWKMIGRERLFKQTLFPAYGYILILIVLPFFTRTVSMNSLAQTDRYLFLLYAFLLIAATLPAALLTGNNQHAAWIFKSIPLQSPAVIFKGCIKAAFARFFVPLYLAVSSAVCSIWGIKVLPDVFIAFTSIYLFTLLFHYFQRPSFPFALEKSALNGGDGFIRMLMIIAVAVAFGFLHKFLLHWYSFTNLLLIPFNICAILYVNRVMVYRRITWKAVDRVNTY